MVTKELEENINVVRSDARRRGLEQMTVEHLALVLVRENSAVRDMLADFCADVRGLKDKLTQFITSTQTARPYGSEPQPSAGFKRVLQRAMANSKGKQQITGVHVLAAIFSEPDSPAAYYMQKYGIEKLAILARLSSHALSAPSTPSASRQQENDLVAQAQAGKLDKPSGRSEEVALLIRTLSCKYKNNALLVGEPGVGKTAIVHALAHHIAAGEAPANMSGMRILSVSVAELVAGTKYRGDFEQRVQQLVEKCHAHGNTVLFIDEIHTLVGAGAVSGSALDGANVLKPLLEERKVRYIGATTQVEYRRIFEKDRALTRRFKKITVREPDDATLMQIMQRGVTYLSKHHGTPYAAAAADAAVEVSRRYLPAQCLPDKALALLDEAGAMRQLLPQDAPIDKEDIEQIAREAAGLPPASGSHDTTRLAGLQQRLADAVLQQDEAAARLARAVLAGHLNYREGNSVVGAFLFHGPTGVGKTEMARQLALQLELPLLRYDMSEYVERHTLSRLIGAPPGYVGFEQSGKLIEDVVQHPAAVVLFDEVEKAHPDVLNILLQILDYGTLTDNSGRRADFRSTLILLTSNLGSSEMERGSAGFVQDDAAPHGEEAVRHFFQPEMRNRMDAVIRFHPLSPQTVAQIVEAQLTHLVHRLAVTKNIRVRISSALRRSLCEDGYSPSMGARPLQRLIRERILEPLALAEAAGDIHPGGKYHLDEDGIPRPQAGRQRQRQTQRRKVAAPA